MNIQIIYYVAIGLLESKIKLQNRKLENNIYMLKMQVKFRF